jgi:hypothetical protein
MSTSKINWRSEPFKTYRRATGSQEKALEMAEFMKKNIILCELIIEEYSYC